MHAYMENSLPPIDGNSSEHLPWLVRLRPQSPGAYRSCLSPGRGSVDCGHPPPKGGLPLMDKHKTLPQHGYRDELPTTMRPRLPPDHGGSLVLPVADFELARRLRWRPLSQYFRFVFSLLDGMRVGGYRLGIRGARHIQGVGAARGIARPFCRHVGDCLRSYLRDVVDMAVLSRAHE